MADASANPDRPPDSFSVADARDGASAILSPVGELDMATVPDLEQAVRRARAEADVVVIDLSGLSFIDSAGVSFLLRADAESRADGFRLELVPGPPAVHRVFELVGMAHRLPFRA